MLCFRWVSARQLPPGFDLRARGWRLRGGGDDDSGCARLVDVRSVNPFYQLPPVRCDRSQVLGVGDSRQCARWLMRGYGDALSWNVGLEELALRATRLLERFSTVMNHNGLPSGCNF